MTHPGRPSTEATLERIQADLQAALPGASIDVRGGGGHFEISVVSERFEGLGRLARQRRVYAAIKELMSGDDAPVHAVDRMSTMTPAETRPGTTC
jgi:acid stress-induced BolA-like protein IbaG/YrbA